MPFVFPTAGCRPARSQVSILWAVPSRIDPSSRPTVAPSQVPSSKPSLVIQITKGRNEDTIRTQGDAMKTQGGGRNGRNDEKDFSCSCDFNPFCFSSLGRIIDIYLKDVMENENSSTRFRNFSDISTTSKAKNQNTYYERIGSELKELYWKQFWFGPCDIVWLDTCQW